MDRADGTIADSPTKIIPRTGRNAAAACLISCAVILLSFTLPVPDTSGRILQLPTICPFHQITGLPCPGCGLTRAFVLIGHGEWRESLAFHPLGWLAYAGFLLMCADGPPMLLGARAAPLLPQALKSRLLWIIAGATLAGGLLRLTRQICMGSAMSTP